MNYTFSTDEQSEATAMLHSDEAWACLGRIRDQIRSHKKHDAPLDLDVIYQDVLETLEWIE